MVGSQKILTVSYGTFSCTLEGFDDSFGTMKAIAEYFRDLASEDRYFGAEPPVPDAEMLTRIAEREIARRVEARVDASGIVLRATGPGRAEVVAAHAARPQQIDESRAALPAAAEASPAGTAAEGADHTDPASLLAAAAPAGQTMDAARDDDQTPVRTAASEPAEPEMSEPVAAAIVDQIEVEAEVKVEAVAVAVAVQTQAIRPRPAPVAMPPAARMPEAPVMLAAAATAVGPAAGQAGLRIINAPGGALPAHPDQNSVAAKLQRIRDVVGKSDETPDETDDNAAVLAAAPAAAALVPDQPVVPARAADVDIADPVAAASEPDAQQPIRARVIRMRRADFDLAVAQGQIATPAAGLPPAVALAAAPAGLATLSAEEEADLMAELAAVEQEASHFAAAPQDEGTDEDDWEPLVLDLAPPADWHLPEADPAPQDEDARMAAVLAALDDDADGAAEPETGDRPAADFDIEALTREMAGPGPQATVDAEEWPQTLAQESADAPDAVAVDDDAQDAIASAEDAVASAEDAIASAEDEMAEDEAMVADHDAAVAATLAAISAAPDTDVAILVVAQTDADAFDSVAEVDQRDAKAAGGATADTDGEAAQTSHEHLRVEADEAALSRIMSQTDMHLNAEDSSRRRAAITQLRAAVAATEAARRLGDVTPEADDDEVENAFRDDLKQAVRPRRPIASGEQRSDRPRPAPLKLVASQRIDQPVPALPAPGQTIRPRRVMVAADPVPAATTAPDAATPVGGARSFAEFAEEMGATTLSDLLEAAAAYTSFVEGVEDFSRPQLMKKVSGVAPERYNREDTLRSFGTLLREGRITRAGTGRFQVAQETRFHPSRRAG